MDEQANSLTDAGDDGFPIIGIGASAGGLEALQTLVAELPVDTGVAYVVVQHLSPNHRSIMDQLLQAKTRLPVQTITNGQTIKPDTLYVAPAGVEVAFDGPDFRLTARDETEAIHLPIDSFFAALSEARGRQAYCVILSGTGSDGTAGMKAIKARGGIAIVQESGNARFPGMPDSAVATGLVEFILTAQEIPARLHDLVLHRSHLDSRRAREELHSEIEARLTEFTSLLGADHGHEFADYKSGTLVRRIERRMSLLRISTVDAFLERLSGDADETNRLVQDFLIGVTEFFRDPAAFATLNDRVIEPMMQDRRDACRVWVPGCSTGEEAYSIAILLMEAARKSGTDAPIQVFGTDIDTPALAFARNGIYAAASMRGVSPDVIDRYFVLENGRYRAIPRLREICVFAPHNLIQDPPFSRLDLISCRNLLIYMKAVLQARIIPRFHFATRKGGHLFLGPSEGLSGADALFDLVDQSSRIFARNDEAKVRYSPLTEKPFKAGKFVTAQQAQPYVTDMGTGDYTTEAKAERAYLTRFAQPFALVTKSGEITYLSEKMTRFVRPSSGVPSSNIDAFLTREMRLPVRSALAEARESGVTSNVENIVADIDGERRIFDVMAEPINGKDDAMLVAIAEVRLKEGIGEAIDNRQSEDRRLLENEVISLRKQLSLTLAEFETSSQELKSSNEELLSMNEELQSSNEELETSREELQSINEELETVNAELSENNSQLTRANSDLKNLFESTDIAVLFLDSQFCVRRFTPATTRLFGIRARDEGRPIKDLNSRIDYPELEDDAEEVGRTLQPIEREVGIDATGERFILRIRPYRTTDDRLDGYVITFFDVTERQRAQELLAANADKLARQYAELENLYDTTPIGLSLVDRNMRYLRINRELADINGIPPEAHIGKTQDELVPDIDQKVRQAQDRVFETGEPQMGLEVSGETPAAPGETRHWIVDFYPVSDEHGTVFAMGSCVREVTEEKRLMGELAESESRIKRLFDNSPVFVAITEGPDHVFTYSNPPNEAVCGHRDLIGLPFREALPELRGQGIIDRFDQVLATGEPMTVPSFMAKLDRHNDGTLEDVWFTQTLEPVRDGFGQTIGVAAFAFEITDIVEARERAQASEAQKTLLLGELQHRVKNTLATIVAVSRFLAPNATDVADYIERLQARLGAISRTHDLLTSIDWLGANFADIVTAEISPFEIDGLRRVEVVGDHITLSPEEALSLGMAIHELVTNSIKYGALSVDSGTVEVSVSTSGADWTDHRNAIVWTERGGPPVTKPGSDGFGSFLLDRVLGADLSGTVEMLFEPDGLCCRISFPGSVKADG